VSWRSLAVAASCAVFIFACLYWLILNRTAYSPETEVVERGLNARRVILLASFALLPISALRATACRAARRVLSIVSAILVISSLGVALGIGPSIEVTDYAGECPYLS
jgi:hypothetical protein